MFWLSVLAFCSFSMWLVPHKGLTNLQMNVLVQLPAGMYSWFGLCFLALAALRIRARRRAAGEPLLRLPRQRTVPAAAAEEPQRTPAAR